jgi:hypothetical protein
MHDDLGLMASENTIQPSPIANVADFKWTPFYGFFMTIHKAVNNDRVMACFVERFTSVASNIARPTDN